jgi:hypothetical protein
MFARSTTVVGDPSMLDRGVALLRDDVMSALMLVDGCVGLSGLIDRESGRCIATSAWESLEAMRASEDQVAPMRDRLIDTLGGREPLVQEWEIPVMHRTHVAPSGACARVSWIRSDPANVNNSIESFKMIIPELDNLSGFCSASLLINRDTGGAVSTVMYEDAEAVARTRDIARGLRQRATGQTGAEVLEVAEFELALAHLRVPELV